MDVTTSDHNLILAEFRGITVPKPTPRPNGWRYDKEAERAVSDDIEDFLQDLTSCTPEDIVMVASTACAENLKQKKTMSSTPDRWYTDEVQAAKKLVSKARGDKCDARRAGTRDTQAYRAICKYSNWARRNLRRMIVKTQRRQWEDLCEDLNRDPWGRAYSTVCKKFGPPPPCLEKIEVERAIANLFPVHKGTSSGRMPPQHVNPFTSQELRAATRKLSSGRSGGPDGIPHEVAKLMTTIGERTVLQALNQCLREGRFPKMWKTGKLILLRKPGKPE